MKIFLIILSFLILVIVDFIGIIVFSWGVMLASEKDFEWVKSRMKKRHYVIGALYWFIITMFMALSIILFLIK